MTTTERNEAKHLLDKVCKSLNSDCMSLLMKVDYASETEAMLLTLQRQNIEKMINGLIKLKHKL